MAIQLRIEYPGALYHVKSRGNIRGNVYCSTTGKEKKKLEVYFLRTYIDYSREEISAKYITDKSASALSNIFRRFDKGLQSDVEIQRIVESLTNKMCCGEVCGEG